MWIWSVSGASQHGANQRKTHAPALLEGRPPNTITFVAFQVESTCQIGLLTVVRSMMTATLRMDANPTRGFLGADHPPAKNVTPTSLLALRDINGIKGHLHVPSPPPWPGPFPSTRIL